MYCIKCGAKLEEVKIMIKKYIIHMVIIVIILIVASGCSDIRNLRNKDIEQKWKVIQEIDEVGNVIDYIYDENGRLYLKRTKGCDTIYVYKGSREEYHYDVDTYKNGEGAINPHCSINVYPGEDENDKMNEINKLIGEDVFWGYIEIYYYDKNNRIIKYKIIDGERIDYYEYSEFNDKGDYTKVNILRENYENGNLESADETENVVEYKYKDEKQVESIEKRIDENGIEKIVLLKKNIYDTEGRKIENKVECYYEMETVQVEQYIYYDYDDYGNVIRETHISKFGVDQEEILGIRKFKYEEDI